MAIAPTAMPSIFASVCVRLRIARSTVCVTVAGGVGRPAEARLA
jgi:hypothetical protein